MNVIERRNVHEPSKNKVVNDQSSKNNGLIDTIY